MNTSFNVQTLSTAPRLHVVDDFLGDDEIEHVLRLAEHPESLAPALVPDRSEAGLSFEMPVGRDAVLTAIRVRIAALLGFGNDLDATFRFRRYAPGEQHPPHTDAFVADGSALIVTALIGLVAPDRGGETEFPLASGGPIAVSQQRGRLVLWYNYTPDGQVDQQSLHAGSVVDAGEKTTLTAFVYKPTYYAASPFPAVPRPAPQRHLVCLHGGGAAAVTRAWVNAAEWMGFAVDTWDARGIEAVPDADVLLPADFTPAVRRVLTAQFRDGWTGVFTGAPRFCEDVPLFLSRMGFPMRDVVACPSADEARLVSTVERVGGFPVEAWIGTWISVYDTETLTRLALRAQALRQQLTVRAPLCDADRRWVAVVDDRCIGPSVSPEVAHLAVRAVRALHARTGVVEYVLDGAVATELIDVNAPTELSRLPGEWWAPYCLAVIECLAPVVRPDVRSGGAP